MNDGRNACVSISSKKQRLGRRTWSPSFPSNVLEAIIQALRGNEGTNGLVSATIRKCCRACGRLIADDRQSRLFSETRYSRWFLQSRHTVRQTGLPRFGSAPHFALVALQLRALVALQLRKTCWIIDQRHQLE